MTDKFNPIPNVPPEVEQAAQSGELVVFVGAGISRLISCPSWDGFADAVLHQLVPEPIDYYQLAQIQSIPDPKKRLSIARILSQESGKKIDYRRVLEGRREPGDVYTHLNAFNSVFVTTNYEKYLAPLSRAAEPEESWRVYGRENLLSSHLDVNGNVIHLHGCIDDPEDMVVTTRQYLEHYASKEVQNFLESLFNRKTVLFLGYGMDETEILEYILRRGGSKSGEPRVRRFILQGFFNAETKLFGHMKTYYRESFSTDLIGYPKDEKSFDQQTTILESWSRALSFLPISLTDEAAALEDEIRG
jgi:hypothetical protein